MKFHKKYVFLDRQRNEEKRRFAMEETMRLEAEKERKRKGLPLSKVSKDYYNLTGKSIYFC